ncbi:MAG: HAD-IIIA family hydrolase [Chthoniobacteraceae bacterium]
MSRQLVIISGGLGTRLRTVLGDLPKPMAEIAGKPLLQHQIECAARYGFTDVLLLTSYRSEVIEQFFGNGEKFGVRLAYCVDETPLGTAGAVLAAREALQDRFAVSYGDTLFDLDLDRMWKWHEQHQAEVSLLLHPNDHPHDSDLVEMDRDRRVLAFHGYPHPEGLLVRNCVNAAFYILEKAALAGYPVPEGKLDFGKELFPRMVAEGRRIFGYESREYIKDMGTPERLEKVRRDFASGKVRQRNFAHPVPAVFLDRDGTVVRDPGWINDPATLELLPGAGEAIRRLNRSEYLTVLVTNQPVIARGECDEATLERIHARMEALLGADGAFLDAIYYCPHHPDSGFPGERPELKIKCNCRKPAPGMLLQAAEELNIDLARSWMIGDSWRDIDAGAAAGVRNLLIGESELKKAEPAARVIDLQEAVELVLKPAENPCNPT